MNFSREDVHTSILKASKYSQLTIDEDFNIPEAKGDIEKIIAKDGHVIVENVLSEDGRVKIIGTVYFQVLYKCSAEDSDMEIYGAEIPFEDRVNVDEMTKNNPADCMCRLEDLTVSMINSRKLEVRGLLGNSVNVYETGNVNCAVDLENGQGLECLSKDVAVTETVISKRDVFKIRESIDIPQNKPNIKEILWSSVELRNMETRPLTDKISIRGEVEIFVIYRGEEEHLPIQYLFSARAISKEIECQDAREEMILDAECVLGKGDVTIDRDADGEERVILVDYSVDMNIKMYEDKNIKILTDLYSPQLETHPVTEKMHYENLLMKNSAKAKITQRKRVDDTSNKMMQICHVFGSVDLDDVSVADGEIRVEGVVKANILYVSDGDDPMNCMETELPFEYTTDSISVAPTDSIRISPCIDQLGASLVNSGEIEIKAQVNLGITVFSKSSIDVITDMTVSPIDYDKKSDMPGIVGYVVKNGDTIWSIARKYYATTESIRSVNNLESDNIKEGDRLIIVKS